MSDARNIVQDFKKGMTALTSSLPDTINPLAAFMGAAVKDGAPRLPGHF